MKKPVITEAELEKLTDAELVALKDKLEIIVKQKAVKVAQEHKKNVLAKVKNEIKDLKLQMKKVGSFLEKEHTIKTNLQVDVQFVYNPQDYVERINFIKNSSIAIDRHRLADYFTDELWDNLHATNKLQISPETKKAIQDTEKLIKNILNKVNVISQKHQVSIKILLNEIDPKGYLGG